MNDTKYAKVWKEGGELSKLRGVFIVTEKFETTTRDMPRPKNVLDSTDKIDLLRNYFRSEIMIFRAKTMKREEVNTAYSLMSAELFVAEKS